MCQWRRQRETTGYRGRGRRTPLYKNREALLTRTGSLSEIAEKCLDILWSTVDDYVALGDTWLVYQDLVHAYQHPNRAQARR